MNKSSALDAIHKINDNQYVFLHGLAATPQALIPPLLERAKKLTRLNLVHLHTFGDTPWADDTYPMIHIRNYFCGQTLRKKLDYDRIDHIPCLLSEVPKIFRSGRQPIDIALFHVSSPNAAGQVSLGVTCEVARAAFDICKVAIAQVNPRMPFIEGDGVLSLSDFDATMDVDTPIPEHPHRTATDEESRIGAFISELVEDGSTIQVGIGGLPDAVLSKLKGHKNLGLHSEMWSDGVLDLIETGVIDNSQKKLLPGKSLSSFVMGSEKLYRFCHQNKNLFQKDIAWVNDLQNIASNPKMVSINAAIEIDLTGQVCSDSVGTRIISGFGGQLDFIRGAALSEGGKPIIALTSRTPKGQSRIVPVLKPGAGVVTTRAHIRYVVTEYGIADLWGLSLHERRDALVGIAHPEDREKLRAEWNRLWKKLS